jgi:hypothetical protein
MADFISLLTSGSSPGAVTAGFGPYEVQVGKRKKETVTAFQYFPERISDSRSPNYSQKEIPGGSHPLYQFVSGGERTMAFDALFANDSSRQGNDAGGLIGGVLGFLGGGNEGGAILNNGRNDVVDIAKAIDTLRSYTYPKYIDQVSKPPPLITFYLPGSGLTAQDGIRDSIIGILTRCDVAYEAFHRDGTPRVVLVNLEIREVVQTQDAWTFASWNADKTAVSHGYDRNFIDKIT